MKANFMGSNDYSQFAAHEMSLDEVVRMNAENKGYWGWANGMFIAGSDDFIAMRFKTGHEYESVTRALWRKLCKDAPLVADIGTHSGVFTLDAFRAGANAVICAEPHPINYSRLVMNLRKNGFPCAGVFYGAIGDSNRLGSLLVKGALTHCNAGNRMDMKNPNGHELPVRVQRLDTLVPQSMWPDLKVVKIDAENWTPQVLIGMGDMLKHAPDLIVECIESGMAEILKPYGYKFWKIFESGRIEETNDVEPYNPEKNYNGTHEDCRNRFASVRGLP